MKYAEFMQRVQHLAELESIEASQRAARATLSTLGEFLYRTEQGDLEAQLPKELRPLLREREGHEVNRRRTERMEFEDFYNRVKARTDVGYQAAVIQGRAVMAALREAVSPGTWKRLRAQFPPQFNDLLATGDLTRQTIRTNPRSGERG